MDMAESLCCLYETITELLTGCTPVQNKKSLKKRRCSPRIITEKLSSRITSSKIQFRSWLVFKWIMFYLRLRWFFSSWGKPGPPSSWGRLPCWGVRLSGTRASAAAASGLQGTGSAFVAHGLSRSAACGIFPYQGLNLSLALAGRFFITEPPGKPQVFTFLPGVSSLTVAS